MCSLSLCASHNIRSFFSLAKSFDSRPASASVTGRCLRQLIVASVPHLTYTPFGVRAGIKKRGRKNDYRCQAPSFRREFGLWSQIIARLKILVIFGNLGESGREYTDWYSSTVYFLVLAALGSLPVKWAFSSDTRDVSMEECMRGTTPFRIAYCIEFDLRCVSRVTLS